MGFEVWGLGFGVWGLRFWVWGLGFWVLDSGVGVGVQRVGFEFLWFGVWSLGFEVRALGDRRSGFELQGFKDFWSLGSRYHCVIRVWGFAAIRVCGFGTIASAL